MFINKYLRTGFFGLVAFVFMVVGCKRESITVPDSPLFSAQNFKSPLTTQIVNRVNLVKTVLADTLKELAPGVKQTTIRYIDYSNLPMALYILEVDLNNPRIKIKAGTPNNNNAFSTQVVSGIASTQDGVGNKVLAAVNGDFFGIPGQPLGEPQSILFKNAVGIKPMYKLCTLCTYLSVDDMGKAAIGTKTRSVDSLRIKEAVGGYHLLVQDSARVSQGDPSIDPRTAVGVTSGNIVYFVVVDGRQPAYSNGMSFAQLSNVFMALGVKDAINMDGGGSSTLVVREGSNFAVKNIPLGGVERAVANAWTIVDTQ